MRRFFVGLHRWIGLAMTAFLIVTGLSGSVLAFKDELDLWLNPDLLCAPTRDAPMLDPLILREKAEALSPGFRVDTAMLSTAPGRSYEAMLTPLEKPAAAPELVPMPGLLTFAFPDRTRYLYLDPYTGEKLGERRWADISLARKDIVSFIHRLHMTLALPDGYVGLGGRILGVVALLWTIDCFVSFYLTFPLRLRKSDGPSGRSWARRWAPSWLIRWRAGAFRLNFDIHRAFGLWTWAMLLVFALSSLCFNLNEVYRPVMQALFGAEKPPPAVAEKPTPPPQSQGAPTLGWEDARERGRVLLAAKAEREGFSIVGDKLLVSDRDNGRYAMCADTRKRRAADEECVIFSAAAAAPDEIAQPPLTPMTEWPWSSTITWWVTNLHLARVFGLPMKIVVCVMGLVIAGLSGTGVYIWAKKRRARRRRCDAIG